MHQKYYHYLVFKIPREMFLVAILTLSCVSTSLYARTSYKDVVGGEGSRRVRGNKTEQFVYDDPEKEGKKSLPQLFLQSINNLKDRMPMTDDKGKVLSGHTGWPIPSAYLDDVKCYLKKAQMQGAADGNSVSVNPCKLFVADYSKERARSSNSQQNCFLIDLCGGQNAPIVRKAFGCTAGKGDWDGNAKVTTGGRSANQHGSKKTTGGGKVACGQHSGKTVRDGVKVCGLEAGKNDKDSERGIVIHAKATGVPTSGCIGVENGQYQAVKDFVMGMGQSGGKCIGGTLMFVITETEAQNKGHNCSLGSSVASGE